MYTSYGWELTNLLQGQDEEYLLEVLTENYRRLRDVPDHLIVTLLEYRGYTILNCASLISRSMI